MNGANAPYLNLIKNKIGDATPDAKTVATTGVVSIDHNPADLGAFDLHSVQLMFDSPPVSAGSLQLQVVNGSDVFVITEADMTGIPAGGYWVWTPNSPLPFAEGEKLHIAYSNPDACSITVRSMITPRK